MTTETKYNPKLPLSDSNHENGNWCYKLHIPCKRFDCWKCYIEGKVKVDLV